MILPFVNKSFMIIPSYRKWLFVIMVHKLPDVFVQLFINLLNNPS